MKKLNRRQLRTLIESALMQENFGDRIKRGVDKLRNRSRADFDEPANINASDREGGDFYYLLTGETAPGETQPAATIKWQLGNNGKMIARYAGYSGGKTITYRFVDDGGINPVVLVREQGSADQFHMLNTSKGLERALGISMAGIPGKRYDRDVRKAESWLIEKFESLGGEMATSAKNESRRRSRRRRRY
jgi:hypothetical protein